MRLALLTAVLEAIAQTEATLRHLLLRKLRRIERKRELRRRRPRAKPLVRVDPLELSDCDFREHFRFNKGDIPRLVAAYNMPDVFYYKETRQNMPGTVALLLVLARLASPGWWRSIVPLFGRRKGTLKPFFRLAIVHMLNECKYRLQRPSRTFLTDARLAEYTHAIRQKGCPYRNVFGFIDGTIYRISRPSGHTTWQRAVYNGHKKCHGLKWQGVNTPDGLIQFLHGPFPGTRHDRKMLTQSGLLRLLQARFALPQERIDPANSETHYMLFGDPGECLDVTSVTDSVPCGSSCGLLRNAGYVNARSNVLQAPFFHPRGYQHLPPDRRNFNIAMARVRVTAEWMFKDVTNLWSYLTFPRGLRVKQSPVAAYYLVAADLTNVHTVVRGQCQTSLYFNCPPPDLETYLQPREFEDGEPDIHVPDAFEYPHELVEGEEYAVDGMQALLPHLHEPAIIPAGAMEQAMYDVLEADANQVEAMLDEFGALNLQRVWDRRAQHAEV